MSSTRRVFGGEKFILEPQAPRNFKGQQHHERVIGRQLAVKRGPATLNSTKALSPRDAYRTKGTGSRQFHCRVFPPHTKFYAAHPVSGFETTFISPTLPPNDTPRQHPTSPRIPFSPPCRPNGKLQSKWARTREFLFPVPRFFAAGFGREEDGGEGCWEVW